MKYSIWIIPSEPVFTELQKVIDKLADENNSPKFEPHLTIVGGIDNELSEIESALNKIANNYEPLTLNLGVVSFSTTYFQSVLIRVNSTATLMNLNLDIKKELNLNNDPLMPHMSLLYGDHDMETREKIASGLSIPSISFDSYDLVVTPSTMDPTEWKHVLTIPFKKN